VTHSGLNAAEWTLFVLPLELEELLPGNAVPIREFVVTALNYFETSKNCKGNVRPIPKCPRWFEEFFR